MIGIEWINYFLLKYIQNIIHKMEKIFVVLYKIYQFDNITGGIQTGGLEPAYISLDPNKAKEKFDEYVKSQKDSYERLLKNNSKYIKAHPEDYQIYIDDKNEFELWVGNWCYYYKLTSYDLDENLIEYY